MGHPSDPRIRPLLNNRLGRQELRSAGLRTMQVLRSQSQNPPPIGPSIAERRMHVAGGMRIARPAFNDPQTYQIIGAGMAVHRELGCGFLEQVHRAAFTLELEQRGIPFVREARLPVRYRNRLPVFYRVDFICYEDISSTLTTRCPAARRSRAVRPLRGRRRTYSLSAIIRVIRGWTQRRRGSERRAREQVVAGGPRATRNTKTEARLLQLSAAVGHGLAALGRPPIVLVRNFLQPGGFATADLIHLG